ncbi:hypothetical protein PR048_004687 [Dryococelus australis]|uniref:Uncharacterized protein n=1 Tax=Dryococelus australis TaxID=614101 RepID=A0ABQ9I631_9NEOP|nr:hypothetical protein PR048_004687 [Dryococelus australis]
MVDEEMVKMFETFGLSAEDGKKFDVVVQSFETHLCPNTNVVVEWFKFNSRVQELGELLDNFLTELKKLIRFCASGDLHDSFLRDQIVLGIIDRGLQERLLRETEFTLQKSVDMCPAAEVSRRQVETITRADKLLPVAEGKSSTMSQRTPRTTLSRASWHSGSLGGEGDLDSPVCGKCRSRHPRFKCPAFEQQSAGGEDELFVIASVGASGKSKICVENICGQGQWVTMKLDTVAKVKVLPVDVLSNLRPLVELSEDRIVLAVFGGNTVLQSALNNGASVPTKCVIVDDVINCLRVQPLLGLRSCLEWNLVLRKHVTVLHSSNKRAFIESNREFFEVVGIVLLSVQLG